MANVFQINLTQSYNVLAGAPNRDVFVDDHWLNDDGTVTVKTWFSRIIYWIRDLFYDKTSRDVYAIFKRCVGEYAQTVTDYRALRNQPVDEFRDAANSLFDRVVVAHAFLIAPGRQIPCSKHNEYDDLSEFFLHAMDFLDPVQFASQEAADRPAQLTERGLKVGPVNMQLHLLIAADDAEHQIEQLLDIFDLAFPAEGRSEADEACRKAIEDRLLPVTRLAHPVTAEDVAFLGWSGMDLPPTAFFEQLNHMLKNIVAELKNPELDEKKRAEVLQRLGHAVTECPARWIGEVVHQYKALTSQGDTLRARVLLWVQALKENTIYQDLDDKTRPIVQALAGAQPDLAAILLNMTIHLLNHCRLSEAGVLYKLDGSTAPLDQAVFISRWVFELLSLQNMGSWFFPNDYLRDLLLRTLTPEKIVEEVATQMESERESWPLHVQEAHEFLLNVVKSVGIENPEDYVAATYYDEENHINAKGIDRILHELAVY